MLERFDRYDRRFVLVCVAVALVCGGIALRYFHRAFPEAAIQFAVNRSQSDDVARAFLQRIGAHTDGYKHAAIFDYDEPTKTYLERQLGIARAQEVYGRQVRLWRWSHRWFRPHQKEELSVDVTAAGEIAGFTHLLPEEAPGATLAADSARALAERFLTTQMGLVLADYEFVEASSSQRPSRLDHTFTWKRRGLDFGDPDATYRTHVEVAGERIVRYDEALDIPQAWQDDYQRLRARNDTAALVAAVFLALTVLAMIVVLVLRVRDHDVRWRIVLAFGVVAFILQFLTALNQFDLEKFHYETQDGYASFVTQFLLQAVLGALAGAGAIVLFTAAAEPLYREHFPQHLALASYFTPRGLRTKSFFKQLLLGLTLMFFFAAYQAVFYLVAARFGAWAPLEVPYSNLLNTAIPWALVLFVGFFPAVSEEFMSRMFSLPFLGKHLARVGLHGRAAVVGAVLLASFIWGFAHSNYPNQPFWIRGFEVGLAGVLVSLVMLRWGILATLVWHYTVDAFYTSLLMLRSGNAYFVVSGAVTAGIMLVPLVAALVLYFRHHGFEPAAGLQNADLPGPRPPARADAEVAATPVPVTLAPISRLALLGGAIVAAASLALYALPVQRPGDGIRIETDRQTAIDAGREHLRALGDDPDRWRLAIQLASRYEPEVGRYVLEHTNVGHLNSTFTSHLRTPVWRMRFFRNDEREEWLINVPVTRVVGTHAVAPAASPSAAAPVEDASATPPATQAGATPPAPHAGATPTTASAVVRDLASLPPLWAFEHIEPDTTAGDTLSMDAARERAAGFLRTRGIETAPLALKESRAERQPNRIDHVFEWEVPDSTLGEAGVRYRAVVHGGEVAGLRPYMHLPEAWVRAFEAKSVLQRIVWVASRGIVGVIVFALIAVFVQQVKLRRFRWRVGLAWGIVAGILSLVLTALHWQSDVLWTYQTTMPYQLFLTSAWLSFGLQFLFTGAIVFMLVGTALAIRPNAAALWNGGIDRRSWRDALVLALVAVVLQFGIARFGVVLGSLAPHLAVPPELLLLPAAARPLPWLDLFLTFARNTIVLLAVIAILLHAAQRFLGVRRALLFLFVGALLFAADGARSGAEFALQAAGTVASAAAAAFVALGLLRGNDLAWVLAIVLGRGVAQVPMWVRQPAAEAKTTGIVLGVLVVVTAVFLAWLAARRSRVRTAA
jgi:membrane protease YdiL (CAAX protease family)